jgi:hypothetical protein
VGARALSCWMTHRSCPRCDTSFDAGPPIARVHGALAGAATGAYLAGGVGSILGPLGVLGTALPGALLGATLGWLGLARRTRCPTCV